MLGVGLDGLGDHEQAEEVLRRAETEATSARKRAELSIARADNLFRGLSRVEDALEVVADAEAALDDDDPTVKNGLVALRAIFLLFEGRLREALDVVMPLLEQGTTLGYAQGALAASVALALSGRTAESIDTARRGAEARLEVGEHVQLATPGVYLVAEAQALLEAGRMYEAGEYALLGYEGSLDRRTPHGQAWFACILGRIELHRGRAASAARWSREAGVVWRELRHPAARWGFGALACALALAGDLDGAEDAFGQLDAEPSTPVGFDPEIDRGRAWVAAQRGEHTRARALLNDAADAAEAGGALAIAAGALHDLARLGEARLAAERLAVIEPQTDGVYVGTCRDHADVLGAGDADVLDAVSERFEVCGAVLVACEAASAAASLHNQAGLRRKATASAQHAAALLAECEGARPFGVVAHVPGVSLTRREREVARARGTQLDQPGDRRTARGERPNGREPSPARLREAGRAEPPGAA